MAHSPFESWKRRAPSDGDEAQAAKLIQRLGEADALSPQALHRVAHRLRAPERRHLSLFSDVRLAAASVAVLVLFVVGAWATVGFFDRQSATTPLAARQRPVQQMVATNDAPPAPPNVAPELKSEADADLRLAKPMVLAAKKAPLRVEPKPEPLAELAMRDRALGGVRPPAGPTAAAAAAPAAAPASAAAAPPRDGTVLSGMSVEGCRSTMAIDSATLASDEGDLEQALFRHGVCLLLTGRKDAGTTELRTSLERYPDGRFAEGIRALLVKNPAQTPPR